MPAYKDKAKGTWYASFYYEDWTGKKVKKMKRGFPTKREALEWERTFLQQQTADLEMTFENYQACKAPKRLFIVPGAGHGMSYFVDRPGYEQETKQFWTDCEKAIPQ